MLTLAAFSHIFELIFALARSLFLCFVNSLLFLCMLLQASELTLQNDYFSKSNRESMRRFFDDEREVYGDDDEDDDKDEIEASSSSSTSSITDDPTLTVAMADDNYFHGNPVGEAADDPFCYSDSHDGEGEEEEEQEVEAAACNSSSSGGANEYLFYLGEEEEEEDCDVETDHSASHLSSSVVSGRSGGFGGFDGFGGFGWYNQVEKAASTAVDKLLAPLGG